MDVYLGYEDVNHRDEDNRTPMMHAAVKGDTDVVLKLLMSDVDVNARDNDGNSALLLASCHGQTIVVSILIAAEADLNIRDEMVGNMTSLMWAANKGHTDVLRHGVKKDHSTS